LENIEARWGTGVNAGRFNATAFGDEAFRRWVARWERIAAPPNFAVRELREWIARDFRPILPAVRVPTLVLHRTDDPSIRVGHGRYLGAHIPGATYVELPGDDHCFCVGDQDAILDEIEEFITGVPPLREPDRALATVLFTDVVGSTARIAEIGDRKWSDLLSRHNEIVGRSIAQFRGRHVNSAGEGVFSTFDGPARAIRCAQAIRDALRSIGVEVRAGLHTGEVELAGDDVRGIAVHIGARVSALAGPGDVLVSRTVTDLVAGSGLEFEERGEHELKGVPGKWAIYAVNP
jgi:class 3 adenylate cyclase